MEDLTEKFKTFRATYGQTEGYDQATVDRALAAHVRTSEAKYKLVKPGSRWRFVCRYVVFPIAMAVIFTPIFVPELRYAAQEFIQHSSPCLIENNMLISEISRPLFDCEVCRDLRQAPILNNISRDEFLQKYAYSTIPVLVKGTTLNWTAMNTFSFNYFRALYKNASKRLDEERGRGAPMNGEDEMIECQFFAYKTEFNSLEEALEMSEERASYQAGEKPWYFGWSNCNPGVSEQLRQHYERPDFLPLDSESSSIDWIFMGGNGPGAFMHLDNVLRPSWQAQITGSKTWMLQPVPECEHICHPFNITMEAGDIIVVDTNQWYHATYIHPGALSITIGSEYD